MANLNRSRIAWIVAVIILALPEARRISTLASVPRQAQPGVTFIW
jgi:hypothetical protein